MTDKNFNKAPENLTPNRARFSADPFGYSALAWHKWETVKIKAGFNIDVKEFATDHDLKDSLLWLTQAHALSEAASVVLKADPKFESMPLGMRSICDSQYCAAGLMLVGYSLEVCLKAMLLMQKGIADYSLDEKEYLHHDLTKLANFVPYLTDRDKAILNLLTHFIYWAGRYPDPGSGKSHKAKEIFTLSEKHKISAKDLFELSAQIMKHTKSLIGE